MSARIRMIAIVRDKERFVTAIEFSEYRLKVHEREVFFLCDLQQFSRIAAHREGVTECLRNRESHHQDSEPTCRLKGLEAMQYFSDPTTSQRHSLCATTLQQFCPKQLVIIRMEDTVKGPEPDAESVEHPRALEPVPYAISDL